MPKAKLGQLFEVFANWIREDDSRVLQFVWHGGEPMLCGLDFFWTVVDEQNRVFDTEMRRVRNDIQSNLSLLTEEWIPCLKQLTVDSRVSTSFDIVDGIRGLASGEDLGTKWLDATTLLRNHDFSIGVVYVVHRKSLGRARDVYDFFRKMQRPIMARFNPIYFEGRGRTDRSESLLITPEEYGQFLVDLCEIWFENGMRDMIAPLSEWHQAWEGNLWSLCCESLGICHKTHLGIAPDGSVYGCGRAVESRVNKLGNIFEDNLSHILRHPLRTQLNLRKEVLQEGPCRGCKYWSICHGGCPVDSWIYLGDVVREKTYACESRKRVFEHFETLFGPLRPANVHLFCDDETGDPRWFVTDEKPSLEYVPNNAWNIEMSMTKVKLVDLKPDQKVSQHEIESAASRPFSNVG